MALKPDREMEERYKAGFVSNPTFHETKQLLFWH